MEYSLAPLKSADAISFSSRSPSSQGAETQQRLANGPQVTSVDANEVFGSDTPTHANTDPMDDPDLTLPGGNVAAESLVRFRRAIDSLGGSLLANDTGYERSTFRGSDNEPSSKRTSSFLKGIGRILGGVFKPAKMRPGNHIPHHHYAKPGTGSPQ